MVFPFGHAKSELYAHFSFSLIFLIEVPRNHQASAGILFRKVNYLRVLLTGVVQSLLVS
jgi:hypothetical protein